MPTHLTLEFIINALSHSALDESTPLASVEIDSREVKPGSLFAALPGEHVDGHEFVGDALQNGAIAALVDRELDLAYPILDLRGATVGARAMLGIEHISPQDAGPVLLRVENAVAALQAAARQWYSRFHLRTIGITGSVGKTTTKELIADVLGQRYHILKSEKSFNNEIGIPLTALRLDDTHQRAVLEMSMYVPGEITLLCGIAPPQVGVLTIIAPVHLERARTLQAIVDAKAELVEALPADGVAILNVDDPNVMSLAKRTHAHVLTYGLNSEADFWADRIEGLGLDGIHFWLHHGSTHRPIRLPLLGQHSVQTALRAAAVAVVEGLSWDEIVAGLENSQSHLRLVAVQGPNGSVILDDTYNASPPSTIAALNLLNDLVEGRRIAVLGDMLELGDYEEQGHRDVGIRAAAVASLLVTVGERGRIIAREAVRAGMPAADVKPLHTAEDAAAYLLGIAHPGDTILVKGSRAVGMERIVAALQQAAA